jgi:hypothetical protein
VTAVLILTSPRDTPDPWEYLERTRDQVDIEGIDARRAVVCDGKFSGMNRPGWWVFEYEKPKLAIPGGNKLAYWHLLEQAWEVCQHGDDAIVLEDDIELAKNALRRMAGFHVPRDLAWVQFFSPQVTHERMTPGLWRPPRGTSAFCQAIKFPSRTLERLIPWQCEPEFLKFSASDDALKLAAIRLGLNYGVHVPDLVQHAGALSLTGAPGLEVAGRLSRCWPGPDFDALSLYARDELYR